MSYFKGMRIAAFGLCLLMMAGCSVKVPVAGHTPRSTFGQATAPDGWERAFWGAVQKKDWSGIERHLSTNYVFSGPEGRRDKGQMLAALRKLDITQFEITDFVMRPEGNNFVVSYTLKLQGTAEGKPLPYPTLHVLSVWQVMKRGEVLIAQSESVPQ
jgi:hypothetical protein